MDDVLKIILGAEDGAAVSVDEGSNTADGDNEVNIDNGVGDGDGRSVELRSGC